MSRLTDLALIALMIAAIVLTGLAARDLHLGPQPTPVDPVLGQVLG